MSILADAKQDQRKESLAVSLTGWNGRPWLEVSKGQLEHLEWHDSGYLCGSWRIIEKRGMVYALVILTIIRVSHVVVYLPRSQSSYLKFYSIKNFKGRLPVKWTAYEALLYGKYTTKSDV